MGKSYCFFSAQYLPTMGGVERYTYELSKELIARGNRVTVVTSALKGLPERETSKEGIEIYRLPCLSLLAGRFPVLLPTPTRHRMMRALQNEHFDLVVVNTRFYPHSLYGVRFARHIGCPCIVVEHGTAHMTIASGFWDTLGGWYEHGITALVKRYRPAFYGVSRACCKWLSHFGIEAAGTLYNAVDFETIERLRLKNEPHFRKDLHISPDTSVVVFTGRLLAEKGVRPLAAAVSALAEETKLVLLLAGDGPLFEELRTFDPDHVITLGRLPFEEIVTLLSESDVFCLPSRSEGFCTSYLEAVACRCFAVCTGVGGVDEVLTDDGCGILLKDMCEEELLCALRRALARNDRAACAEKAYQKCVKTYTFAHTADKLEKIASERS